MGSLFIVRCDRMDWRHVFRLRRYWLVHTPEAGADSRFFALDARLDTLNLLHVLLLAGDLSSKIRRETRPAVARHLGLAQSAANKSLALENSGHAC